MFAKKVELLALGNLDARNLGDRCGHGVGG